MNILDKFKSGEIKIILLNTQYAGSGIDINYATDVIIYHTMGIDKQQAIGRAQRVGRTQPLFIHNLCYEHEI
jgi:SNF2 family DNA or RNA helicase